MDHKQELDISKLLLQYADGTITQENRYLLEKQALDDPFLFEALEGYKNNTTDSKKLIERLKANVTGIDEPTKTRRVPIFNYGIAASLVLLLGFGLWFFGGSLSDDRSVAMTTDAQTEVENSNLAGANLENEGTIELAIEENPSPINVEKSNDQYDSPKAIISQQDLTEQLSTEPSNIKETSESSNEEMLVENEKHLIVEQDPQLAIQEESDVNLRAVNEAVSFGNPATDESKEIITADVAKTEAPPQEENLVITGVSAAKAKKSSARLNNEASSNIELDITEYIPSMQQGILVAPHEGISTFKANFLALNQQIEEVADLDQTNVEIQFTVNHKGKTAKYEVITGTDQECINRLIALVKYGGNWITSPKNSEATVRLKMPCK